MNELTKAAHDELVCRESMCANMESCQYPRACQAQPMARIDDVIWVPCRGCTDLAGCEEHRACLTLDGWEVKHG